MPFDSAPIAINPRLRAALVADLFCGAGGSSTGARRALAAAGRRMELVAVNHWDKAIATHSLNHPDARHYLTDLERARPTELVPELRLDLLMASPTCTYHSRARGGRPTSDQQRMDPWTVIRWFTELRIARGLIENVPEYVQWGPIDTRSGRPIKSREGEYFEAWCDTIRRLGGRIEYRILNCADFGDATTRKRFFAMIRFDGKPIRWPDATHAPADRAAMLGLKPWRPAREIIDWTNKGRSIFGRRKPLAPKTLARIYAGAVKFGWPRPFLVILRQHMDGQSVDAPLPAITAGGTHIGLAEPIIISTRQHTGGPAPRTVNDPIPTATATDSRIAVAEPFILSQQNSGAARGLDRPLPTITTGGSSALNHPGCARHAIVEPFVLSQASGGAPRSAGEPLPTIVAGGQRGSGTALIAPYYGSGSGETCVSAEAPLPSVTTKGRFGVVVPVTNGNGGPGPRDIEQPLPTMTTAKGGEFAVVMPVTHADTSGRVRSTDDPLPTVTGAHRGELAFIAAQFGERDGQSPRVHDIAEPAPTICAQGHINLIEPTVGHGAREYDILFRMLEPSELAAAMGFSDAEAPYEFVGTKTEKTKQIGNAVPVNTAAALVAALMSDIAPP